MRFEWTAISSNVKCSCTLLDDGGCLAIDRPCRHSVAGRIGRGTKPPPQFGQTLSSVVSTHFAQNVHSYVQIRASVDAGGKSLSQHSQFGLISSAMASSSFVDRRFDHTGLSIGVNDEKPRNAPSPRIVEMLVFDDVNLLDVAGPLQVFASANALATEANTRIPYRVHVGHHRRPRLVRIEVVTGSVQQAVRGCCQKPVLEPLADQPSLAIPAIRVEAVANHPPPVAHDIGDNRHEAGRHFREVDVGIADRRSDRLGYLANIDAANGRLPGRRYG